MKKLVALFIIVAAFLSLNNSSTFSQPQLKVHITGGYSLPLPDLKGDLNTLADTGTYFMKQGIGFGADVKYYLGKKRNVGLTLGLGYQMFSNSSDSSTATGVTAIKNKLNAFTVGLGIEYNFMPKGKTQPFLGAEFTGHFFSGSFEGKFGTLTTTNTLKSASRFGIAVGGGLDFKLGKSVGAIVGVKYNMANLIGKAFDSTGLGTNEYALDDKEHTENNATVKAKNINYLQLYAGVSFFFNEPKKMVKK
ncbi:MAG: outer membrane beta-barrel protein [Ignavibacteria bacterium]